MQYRREIDGLRAVAVLPVILFHAGFQAFSGGFVGVDVFFVISGYLITSIIVSEQAAGTFSLTRFYERRARRIVPALVVVVLACMPFAWRWLMPTDMKEFGRSVAAVALFYSNHFFWNTSGYFDTATDLKPLLHTWSLAVEEQYYLFFPLITLFFARHGRGLKAAVLLMWAVSFALCTPLVQWGPSAAFFLLPTRTWELLTGALLAIYESQPAAATAQPARAASRWRNLARAHGGSAVAAGGLAMVAYAVFRFDSTTPFPSAYTLVPVLGAAAVLSQARATNVAGRLLGARALVGIGLISYSAYLWHQPLFAFARHATIGPPPGRTTMALLVVATLLLAWASWRFVEQPFRRPALIGRKVVFAIAIVAALSAMGFRKVTISTNGIEARFSLPEEVAQTLVALPVDKRCEAPDDHLPSFQPCTVGELSAIEPSAAIFGDSHAGALLPAFAEIGKRRHQAFVYAGVSACPPLLGAWVLNGYYEPDTCPRMAEAERAYIERHGIKRVYLVSRWSVYTDGDYTGRSQLYLGTARNAAQNRAVSRSAFRVGIERTLQAYRALGVEVFLVEQVPQQMVDIRQHYYRLYDLDLTPQERRTALEQVAVPVRYHRLLQQHYRQFFQQLSATTGVKLIDLEGSFCNDTVCLFGDATQGYYQDADHLSTVGALHLVDPLMAAMPSD